MLKITRITIVLSLAILLAACGQETAAPYGYAGDEEIALIDELQPSETPVPTGVPPTATPNVLQVETPAPETVALDFTSQACSAIWSNSMTYLACPGDLEDTARGYIEPSDHTVLEGGTSVEAPLLIGLPGQGGAGIGLGLFGRYAPITVYPGDIFYATIACQGEAACDLDFSLEYYDQWGHYQDTSWEWPHLVGNGPQAVAADLSALAGQTVEFSLVLRAREEYAGQWGVWIQPYISRAPDAQPLPTQAVLPTPSVDPDDQTPGVITGMVDMSSAPPYLNDPQSGNSSPVAVVFFNLTDGTYWWIHTSLTGHPYYQMTITPGEYQVVAYARGVGDVPYVAGGYTGANPSCGKNLKNLSMGPNGRLENIVIADWNWTCGGTAYRPPKPGGVPLP